MIPPDNMTSHKSPNHNSLGQKRRLLFTGFSMGLADLIPGVSGGTIAFIFGIYDELLYSIKVITGQVPKLVLQGRYKQGFRMVPFSFLLPLAAGMALAIFGLVHVVSYLLETQETMVWSFFFGMVAGSAYIISRRVNHWNVRLGLLLILGFTTIFVMVGLPSGGGSSTPLAIFGTGAIAITAMILPGISGSLIMVLLGQYEIIINAIAARDYTTLTIFAAGAILGLGLFVRLLLWLLKHHHMAVIATLIGVMLGSLRRIWPWQTEGLSGNFTNVLPALDLSLLLAVTLIISGFLAVLVLETVGIAKEHEDINTRSFKKEFHEIEG